MNEEQYQAAKRLVDEQREINRELKIWEKELTKPSDLGYLVTWNSNHPTALHTRIPTEIFDGFRSAAMNALKLRLVEIEREFRQL